MYVLKLLRVVLGFRVGPLGGTPAPRSTKRTRPTELIRVVWRIVGHVFFRQCLVASVGGTPWNVVS